MIVELVSTGSELLLGDTVNTNVSWLAQELNKIGYTIAYQSTVGDNRGRMGDIFRNAANRADIVISTGGLGPTQGDITREVLGSAVGREIEYNDAAMEEVKSFYRRVKRIVPEAGRREAMLPVGSTVLHNPVGVAPGVALEVDGTTFILLPGPPGEMKAMFRDSVVPYLENHFGNQGVVRSHRYGVYGLKELELEEQLMDLVQTQSNPTIAFLIKKGYIELRITAKADTVEEADDMLAPWDSIIKGRLGEYLGRSLDTSIDTLLGQLIAERKGTLSTAESCTGGLVGKRITDVSGSSAYFKGGIISYSNDVKHHVLGVSTDMLETYGAVSEQVAVAMAEGVKRVTGSLYGVSTTGVAGPGGGTPMKPVGLVYVGISGPKGTEVYRLDLIGNREEIRQGATEYALYYMYHYMKEE